jgi:predicted transcriptional regulator
MTEDNAYQITNDTEVRFENQNITKHGLNELGGVGVVKHRNISPDHVDSLLLDINKLRKIAFEYSILNDVANSVEVDVLRYIRRANTDRITTGEIAEQLDRPPATISRTLGNLVEKGQIKKIKNGLYERI